MRSTEAGRSASWIRCVVIEPPPGGAPYTDSPKITDVQVIATAPAGLRLVVVKVLTDQAGLYGWGESSLEWKTRAVVGAVEDFVPMLIGEDPMTATLPAGASDPSFCQSTFGK